MIHVFGGAGFVGGFVEAILQEQKLGYRIFDKALNGSRYADVTKPNSLEGLPGADIVINLAAEHKDNVTPESEYHAVNVVGARNICDYCREKGVRTIIFTSSTAVYGFPDREVDESGEIQPFNEYGKSKAAAEGVYRQWLQESPSDRTLIIVRPTVIFGEGNRGNVFNLMRQIATKRFILFGDGKNKKSMAYVCNVAEFLVFSRQLGVGEHLFNYADKPDLTMKDLAAICQLRFFGKSRIHKLPGSMGVLVGRLFDVLGLLFRREFVVSGVRVKKFMSETTFSTCVGNIGFKPRWTLKEGLDRTLTSDFTEALKVR